MSKAGSKQAFLNNSPIKGPKPTTKPSKQNPNRNEDSSIHRITPAESVNSLSSNNEKTKDQMVQHYYELVNQYQKELTIRDQLKEQKLAIQADIASIFIQSDRLDELIQNVKDTKQPEASDDD